MDLDRRQVIGGLYAEKARRSFAEFVRQAWHVLEPNGRAMLPNLGTSAIVEHLQAAARVGRMGCGGPLQAQPAIWTRGNTCEVMPEPLQPADWNFSRRGVNDLLVQGYVLAGFPVLAGAQRAGLFEGRLYLEASLLQWEAWDAIGMTPEALNGLMGGHQPTIDVTPPTWRERLQHELGVEAPIGRGGQRVHAHVRAAGRWQLPPGMVTEPISAN